MPSVMRLEGQRFGRLVVLSQAKIRRDITGKVKIFWLCRCDCGTKKEIAMRCLRQGRTLSCGCFFRELRITHGLSHTPQWDIWKQMIQRCTNPQSTGYAHYGGRGIKVCDLWIDSFESFNSWMGPRPSPRHSIDRINNDGNYEPGNVRWATCVEQARNRRKRKSKPISAPTRTAQTP